MAKVVDILKKKGGDAFSITPDTSAYDALQIMSDKNVGALLVMEDSRLVGIFSERDYARKVVLKGKSSKETKIGELMTPNPYVVNPQDDLDTCMKIMSNKSFRHLPVIDKDTVSGVISLGDVVRTIIENQQFTIEQMEQYIYGYK